MKLTSLLAIAVFLCGLIPSNSSAQVTTGTPPFGSFGGGPDVINLGNLNVHFDVPVRSKAGRGLDFSYDLTFDDSVWSPVSSTGTAAWTPVFNWGWAAQTQIATGYISFSTLHANCDTPPPIQNYITYTSFVYHDAFGGIHPFSGKLIYDPQNCSGLTITTSFTSTAADGSGLVLNAGLGTSASPQIHTITTRQGQVTNPPLNLTTGYSGTTATATDRNGNQISVSSTSNTATYTDTTNNSVISIAGSATSTSPLVLSYTAPSGATANYTITYKSYTVATKFGCSAADYGPTVNNLIDTITLPDTSTYKFTYEATPTLPSDVTGRLASVKLPTGGTITYTYTGGSSGHITCADGSNSGLTRVTPDSATAWTYARSGTAPAYTTTVTDPTGNQTVIQFQGIYETERKTYQGTTAGTLLQTTDTCYNTAAKPCTATAITLPISQRDVYVTLGTQLAKHTTKYNATYGMVTEQDDYAFGSGVVGALIKKQTTTYASLSNGIVAAPFQVTIQDGSGTTKAQTTYTYDAGTLTTTGAPQHVAISGSRGNATTIATLVAGASTLSTTNTYDDAGNVRVTTDPNGAQTTYTYSSSAATCGFAFPTGVSEPMSMSRSSTWNCTGGVQLTATDENSKTTTTKYTDPDFWRPAEQDFPDGGKTTFIYGLNPASVAVNQYMTSTGYKQTAYGYDGMGRLNDVNLTDPFGPVLNITTFDALGRPYRVYNPTRCWNPPTTNCGEATWGYMQYAYDSLNRPTTITDQDGSAATALYTNNTATLTDEAGKKRTLQTDSLGRLTQVTEDPGGSGFVTTYGFDALDNITSVTDGSNSRTYAFDGLSRLTSETNPESGSTTYTYDTSTKGDPYQRTDARGVVTTYIFDSRHRMTGKSYSDSTAPVTYVYDMTNPFSETATNTTGRLVGIWTGTNPGFAAWSAFSYDAMGRPITQWNCASFPWAAICPNIQTTSITYDLAGNPTQTVYPSGLVVQKSYDSSGRVCQIAPSTSSCTAAAPYWAANLTYDPASQLTGVTYGNGVLAAYAYSNRLQETSIAYTKGASTLFNQTYTFGTATTNNGLLTALTDAVDAGRSATYTYDSINRLKTAGTTGSTNFPAWGLSWTYDQYGNRTAQSVTIGSAPSNSVAVSASTNRITTAGYGYDTAGNMTSDGTNTLTYNAEGQVISATNSGNSGSYVYGGDGVRVHQVSGSTTANSIYLGSNLIGQYDNQSGVLGENIFLGGQRIAAVGGASVTNGSFESGLTGWTLTGVGASLVTNATKAHSGNNYVQISTTSSATAQSPTFAVHPGDQIDFGGWVYLETGTAAAVDWVLMTLDVNHNQVATVVPTPWSVTTAGAWTYETGSYQVASNVAYVYFYANVYQSSGTTTARFDDGFAIIGTHYFHPDQLSTRVVTDATGATIGQQGHFPYGESWYAQNTTTNWQFTSYQRDTESGNDYAMARSYVNRLARFSSPDPAAFTAANPSNPQSWNRYAYVLNNPVNDFDPTGLCDQGADECVQVFACNGINDFNVLSCMYDSMQAWLTMQNFGCYASGNCQPQFYGSGGSGGGGSSSASTTSTGGQSLCVQKSSLTWSQRAQLRAAQFYAGLTGWTFGFGAGVDAGAGIGPKGSSWNFGAGGSASTMIVADGSGNSGFLNSASGGFTAVKMSSAGKWWGAGFAAGPSVLVSYNPISTVAGPSGSVSAGGGATLGAGISVTTSGAVTVSFGLGAGAEAGISPQFGTSQFIPICHE